MLINIDNILSLLSESMQYIKKVCSHLIVLLLQLCSKFSDKKAILLSNAKGLASNGFSALYMKLIVQEFQKQTFTNQEKIELLKSISTSIKNCHFYYDDIIDLFDTIDWANESEQFNYFSTIYRKLEPDLASELFRAYAKKYKNKSTK